MTEKEKKKKKLFLAKGIFDEEPNVKSNDEKDPDMVTSQNFDSQKKMKKKKKKKDSNKHFTEKIDNSFADLCVQKKEEYSKKKKKKKRNSSVESFADSLHGDNDLHNSIKKKRKEKMGELETATIVNQKNVAVVEEKLLAEEKHNTKYVTEERDGSSYVKVCRKKKKKKKKKKNSDIGENIQNSSNSKNESLSELNGQAKSICVDKNARIETKNSIDLSSVQSSDDPGISSHRNSPKKKKKTNKRKNSMDLDEEAHPSGTCGINSEDLNNETTKERSPRKKRKKSMAERGLQDVKPQDDSLNGSYMYPLTPTKIKNNKRKRKKDKKVKRESTDEAEVILLEEEIEDAERQEGLLDVTPEDTQGDSLNGSYIDQLSLRKAKKSKKQKAEKVKRGSTDEDEVILLEEEIEDAERQVTHEDISNTDDSMHRDTEKGRRKRKYSKSTDISSDDEVVLLGDFLTSMSSEVTDSQAADGFPPERRRKNTVAQPPPSDICIDELPVNLESLRSPVSSIGEVAPSTNKRMEVAERSRNSTNSVRKKDTPSRFDIHYRNGVPYLNGILQKHSLLLDYSATRIQLRQAGVNCAFGPWTEKELTILRDNIETHKKTHNIEDFYKYYENHRKHELYIALGENINRPIKRIKSKIDSLLLDSNSALKGGVYTNSDVQQLIGLYNVHGNNWSLIGAVLNRDPSSVRRKYCHIKGIVEKRKSDGIVSVSEYQLTDSSRQFTKQEDEIIVTAVNRLARNENGDIVESKINWVLVARCVGTRSSASVRQRWHYKLSKKFDNTVESDAEDKLLAPRKEAARKTGMLCIKILRILLSSDVTDKLDIDWPVIAERIQGNFDPVVLRGKFYRHVNKNVPNYSQKSFQEILEYLIRVHNS